MTTNFPAQIDSFDIRAPEEVILSNHMNDVQDAIVATEVFAKAMEQRLNIHISDSITELGFSHAASEVLPADILGLDTTNLQTSLEDLQGQLDTLTTSTSASLAAHILEDIAVAHPNGNLSGARIDDNTITGDKIVLGEILETHLAFDIANQAELDTHIADDIATAHPNGTFPVARLDVDVATQTELDDHINDTTAHSASAIELSPTVDGYDEVQSFAANVSAFSATVSADLAAHEAASTNVHGIGVESSVVGTKTDQNLEKKTILSDFVGSKVLIWPEDVTDEEKEFFDSSTPSADQIKIRDKSIAVITATDNTGFTILTVDDSSPFTGGQSVEGFQSPGFTISLGSLNVLSVPDANTVELDGYLPALVANDIIVNTSLSALFCVSETGLLTTTGLHVQSHPFNDIELDDNVTITGTLTVTGASDLQDNVAVTGTLAATSNLTAGANITADASITGLNLFATNDLNVSVDATIGGQLLGANAVLSDDLNVFGNFVLDGYASVGSDLSVSGGFDVSNFFSAGNGASVGGGLTVGLDANIGGDLQVFGSTHINDTFTVDGYSVFNDDLFVNGNIIFSELTVSSFTDASRPDPTTISKGVIIFNDDDLTLNVSDGTNWRDMTGSIT